MIKQRTKLLTQLSVVHDGRRESWQFGRASDALSQATTALANGASRCAVATIESENDRTTLADTLVDLAETGQILMNAPAWALCRSTHNLFVEDLGIVRVDAEGAHERLVAVRLSKSQLRPVPRLSGELLGRDDLLASVLATENPHIHLWGKPGVGVQSVALGVLESIHGGSTETWRKMDRAEIDDLPTVQLAGRHGLSLWLQNPSATLVNALATYPCRLVTTSRSPLRPDAIEVPRLRDEDLREMFRRQIAAAYRYELSDDDLDILNRLLPLFDGRLGNLEAAVKALDVLSLGELEAMLGRGVRIFSEGEDS